MQFLKTRTLLLCVILLKSSYVVHYCLSAIICEQILFHYLCAETCYVLTTDLFHGFNSSEQKFSILCPGRVFGATRFQSNDDVVQEKSSVLTALTSLA